MQDYIKGESLPQCYYHNLPTFQQDKISVLSGDTLSRSSFESSGRENSGSPETALFRAASLGYQINSDALERSNSSPPVISALAALSIVNDGLCQNPSQVRFNPKISNRTFDFPIHRVLFH